MQNEILGNVQILHPHILGARTSLPEFRNYWQQLIEDQWALRTGTTGISFSFNTPHLRYNTQRRPFHLKIQHQQIMNQQINEWISNNFLEPVPFHQIKSHQYMLANYFLVEQGEKMRPCLDCSDLNDQLSYESFKMEGIATLRQMILPKDFLMKTDLTKAYHTIPIAPDQRHLLAIITEDGRILQHKGTPFGPGPIPRQFTKLLKACLEPLRKLGIRLIIYIDDILTMGRSQTEVLHHTAILRHHLRNLGFLINYQKSSTSPSQSIDFLGFNINSVSMKISLPKSKINQIKYETNKWIKNPSGTIRQLAQLNGKLAATIQAILPARLKYRALERVMIKGLKTKFYQWEAKIQLDSEAIQELQWWRDQVSTWNGKPMEIQQPVIHFETFMDAAKYGWGIADKSMKTQGNWTVEERAESSNFKETKTILFAFQINKHVWREKTILIHSDNTTAISYMRKMGGPNYKLNQLAKQVWEICLEYKITPIFRHIAGVENIKADQQSRKFADRSAWKLNPTIFHQLNNHLGPFSIDLFANRETTQLPRFYSRLPDPEAEAQDSFAQKWPKTTGYAFPPWNQVNRTIQLVHRQKIKKLTLITPDWPKQTWYPALLQMSIKPPILLHSHPTLLSTNQPITNQINPSKFNHVVWTISNKAWRHMV